MAYVRADLEPEMITDPLLAAVGLVVADRGARGARTRAFRSPSGTVTRVATESFGGMADDGGSAQIEVRASWTPDFDDDAPDAAPHVRAWGDLLCMAAGLQPVPEGVAAMPSRRGQRGAGR